MKLIDQYKGLRKEVYVLFIGRIVTRFGAMVWSMMTMILNQKLGYTPGKVSVFMSIFNIYFMIAVMVGGKLADRFSRKKIILIFDCVSITIYLLCSILPLNIYTVLLIVFGASFQWAEGPSYDALLADITLSEDRERAYALQYLGTNIGLMAAPTLAGFMLKNHLSLLFVISGCAIATSTILIFFKVKNITPIVEPDKLLQRRRDKDSLFEVLKDNKVLIIFALVLGLFAAGYDQYTYLMPMDLGRIYGEDGAVIFGTINSANCIVVILLSSIVLSLFAFLKPLKKVFIAQFMLIIGFVIFNLFINCIPMYYVSVLFFTIGEIFENMGASPFITNHSPASHRGRIQGVISVSRSLFCAVTLVISGKIYDKFGSLSSWYFAGGIMVACILLTLILLRRTKDE